MPTYLDTWSKKRTIGELSLMQRLHLLLPDPSFARSLISGKFAGDLARYLDTSHWNGPLNMALIKPWVHAHMAKCSDGFQMMEGSPNDLNTYVDDQFSDVVQQCYDNALGVIAYPYWQPDVVPTASKDNDRQYQALLYSLRNKKPGVSFHEIRVDLEQKSIEYHTTVRDRLQRFWSWLVEDFGSVIPLSIYTSVGYLNSVPAVRDWIILQKIPVHYAQWIFNTKTQQTWAQAITRVNAWNMNVLNFDGWRACQVSSSLYGMAGAGPGEVDWNIHNGTPQHLMELLKVTGTVPPPPPPPPAEEYAKAADVVALKKRFEDHVHQTGTPV